MIAFFLASNAYGQPLADASKRPSREANDQSCRTPDNKPFRIEATVRDRADMVARVKPVIASNTETLPPKKSLDSHLRA